MTSVASSHKSSGLVLAMGGTEERLQLALGQPVPGGWRMLASREWTVPGESIRFLVPGLKETLDGFGLTVRDIDRIACIRGPGSFTGLRLVLAAAEGLAAGSGAALAGLEYLPLLAAGPAPLITGPLHVLTYARRGLVYLQSFAAPSLETLHPLCSLPLAEAAKTVKFLGEQGHLMGSGLRKNPEFFAELAADCPGYVMLPSRWDNASPEMLLDAALHADYASASIEPVYVRATDAEDNLPNIAKKRGLDPDEAKRRLEELQRS
ncbi:tRNA (adenosine(37)-N6)-threonylcarbamoyltransferase complex dimerization subunit type 1 TsaB [Pseudodesulfovibrio cashew]|uniref:tRNA (Adenosine(37)-N6)-threonylcarbamoyltransferase complex dimerization subunit type 1 TsaB n=1 Tax=Pseudodesulfovibrio cashew TaxID=2678688 RepID=A0A6I6JKI1_9BACT|nr:tRNA (adenosine(37)-N6)-threonylcarbamoyltransferase complex dimerization subunit type 1 TsaB [Pseudodesulfovibrio cashew]QGY40823.1 tRNA (adenosine(37)-N6)-threonylcarbamoyltransferase complex dimerization subunit type 1 TsaB [Pseudodesulfovibrio cashew]